MPSLHKLIRPVLAAAAFTLALSGCSVLDLQAPTQGPASEGPGVTSSGEQHATELVRIIDGDTIAVKPSGELTATNDAGDEHVVRLLSIDAPEVEKSDGTPAQCGGDAAEQNLASLISEGDELTLIYDAEADRTDRYERSLAYVETAEGTDLAAEQAAGGYVDAWFPQNEPQPERFVEYSQLVKRAAQEGHGSWSECDTLGR